MGRERNVFSRHYRFASYWEFEAFDQALTRQLSAGQVQAVAPPSGPVPRQASAYYRLPGSAQLWVLSEPDNAWRGYFLPLAEALAQQQLTRSDRRRWLVLAALLLLGCLLLRSCGGTIPTGRRVAFCLGQSACAGPRQSQMLCQLLSALTLPGYEADFTNSRLFRGYDPGCRPIPWVI